MAFRSTFDRTRSTTTTVMSNTTDGAWAIADRIAELLTAPSRTPRSTRARAGTD